MENLRYPLATLDQESDFLAVDVFEYRATGFGFGQSSQAQADNINEGVGNQRATQKGSIILPIPTQISNNQGVSWSGFELNAMYSGLLGSAEDIMRASLQELPGVVGNSISNMNKTVGGAGGVSNLVKKALATAIVGAVGGPNITVDQILAKTTGQVLNPNMELLFKGPGLRTFNFAFQFAPRNPSEGQEVKNIIKFLKMSMSAKRRGSNSLFLCTPDVFQLTFKKGGEDHPFLNKFKKMALTNMSVNFTASGTYASYDDGTPVMTTVNMTLQELQPVYANDYENTSGVGY